ncbi:CRTAC1 family protein [Gymnodinialimonas ulvae]|uniref:CRTAC1 family protein n=1 Tax=Gymnodinialimonas ulvae TaxID=3126504 RepID=UPI0030B22B32
MRHDILAITCALALPAQAEPIFAPRDIAPHSYTGGWEFFVGGGLSSFDCNGDGLPELFAAGGEEPAQLFLNQSDDTLRFDPVESALALSGVTGSYPLDIDSDGHMDLVVLRVGQNRIFRGAGACRFAEWQGLTLPDDDSWTTAFSATWEAGQILPTLAFGNYVDRANSDGPFGTCAANALYRPTGDTYGAPIELIPGFCALSMLFSDWARQGRADLRVSNDRHYYVRDGAEQLWAMDGTPRLYTEADGWMRHQLWGMGIASQDIDGDGWPEVYLTSMGDQRLQARDLAADGPTYLDAPFDQGATAHRPYTGDDGRPSTGWHPAFGDTDNDGLIDLFVTKGNVEQMPGSAMDDPNNLLLGQPDATFVEGGLRAGIATMARSRGAVLSDLNGDGLLDIAVVNRGAPMELYQNITPDAGGYLSIDLLQPGPNPRAVGAIVDLRVGDRLWSQERTIGGGHAGGSAGPLHFGLGEVQRVQITVHWPDGTRTQHEDIPTNQGVTLTRPNAPPPGRWEP